MTCSGCEYRMTLYYLITFETWKVGTLFYSIPKILEEIRYIHQQSVYCFCLWLLVLCYFWNNSFSFLKCMMPRVLFQKSNHSIYTALYCKCIMKI